MKVSVTYQFVMLTRFQTNMKNPLSEENRNVVLEKKKSIQDIKPS